MPRRLLTVVRAYPNPSRRLQETVCSAAVTEEGEWIRLYPVPYRQLRADQKFRKFQWIECELRRNRTDKRPESHSPDPDTIVLLEMLGGPGAVKPEDWAARASLIVDPDAMSIEALDEGGRTLGTIRPQTLRFTWERTEAEWGEGQAAMLNQLTLFSEDHKPLEKIPYKFSYTYRCYDRRCNGHTQMIVDWELMQTFRKFRGRYGETGALIQLKKKWQDWMWARDLYLIVGTTFRYGSWVVIGVFYPPRNLQQVLL